MSGKYRSILGASGGAPFNVIAPSISGSANVGNTLTVSNGTWGGKNPKSFLYQWLQNGIPILGATSNTYVTVSGDVGQNISCKVTCTNSVGSTIAYSNSITVTQGPINTSAPVISGSTTLGNLLTTTDGTWSGYPPFTFTYQWQRNGINIPSATANTYISVLADVGQNITCVVTADNVVGITPATSNTLVINQAPSNTSAPVISGSVVVGNVLSTTNGSWSGFPTPTYAYQWKRNGVNISGQTASTYTSITADVGQAITCEVTATNIVSSVNATSNSLTITQAPANTIAPVISGTAVVGSALSTTNGTWSGFPTPTFSYQWERNGVNISGATSSSYTLVQADATATIVCSVTATNSVGSASQDSNGLYIYDANANTYITNASITDNTEKQAINVLTNTMKTLGIYTKMRAVYPVLGGTASSNKFNLINPLDTNAAFRLSFLGTWSHSSTGMTPNGTTGYADTFLNPATVFGATQASFGVYTRTAVPTAAGRPIGVTNGTNREWIAINSGTGNIQHYNKYTAAGSLMQVATTTYNGWMANTRTANNSASAMRFDGTLTNTTTTTNTTHNAFNFFLGASNSSGTAGSFSNAEIAFAYISDSLTTTELGNFRTAVITFQTTLGRNV